MLWKIRTELADRPGALAELAARCGADDINILSLEVFTAEGSEAFLWVVPAPVAGRWTLRDDDRGWQGDVELAQQFQRVGGTLTIAGRTQPLLGAFVNGATLGFTFLDRDGAVRSARAQIDGDTLTGELRFPGYVTRLAGRRSPDLP